MIEAVLFDMDGVLVDSEEFICAAAIQMFAEHGLPVVPEDFLPFVGMGENRYLGGVAEHYGFPIQLERDKARTYAIYGEITRGKLIPLPGVHAFIERCRQKNLKLAVATSADRIKMEINLQSLGLPDHTFDATVNGLEVALKKPAPDIYLEAARRLGVRASNCLVVEDAVSGIAAGMAAGSRCLALTTSFPAEKLSAASWICSSLADAPEEAINW